MTSLRHHERILVVEPPGWRYHAQPGVQLGAKCKSLEDAEAEFGWLIPEAFGPPLHASEAYAFAEMAAAFDLVMRRHNIPWAFYGGTVLGLMRHHGTIPWDDDVDMVVPTSDLLNVIPFDPFKGDMEALGYKVFLDERRDRAKIFPVNAPLIPGREWGWPFLDLFGYVETPRDGIVVTDGNGPQGEIPRSVLFPAWPRLWESDLLIPGPAKAVEWINHELHSLNWAWMCKGASWDHRAEIRKTIGVGILFPCENLRNYFPMVFRSPTDLEADPMPKPMVDLNERATARAATMLGLVPADLARTIDPTRTEIEARWQCGSSPQHLVVLQVYDQPTDEWAQCHVVYLEYQGNNWKILGLDCVKSLSTAVPEIIYRDPSTLKFFTDEQVEEYLN